MTLIPSTLQLDATRAHFGISCFHFSCVTPCITTSDPFASVQRFLYSRPSESASPAFVSAEGGQSWIMMNVRSAPRVSEAITLWETRQVRGVGGWRPEAMRRVATPILAVVAMLSNVDCPFVGDMIDELSSQR